MKTQMTSLFAPPSLNDFSPIGRVTQQQTKITGTTELEERKRWDMQFFSYFIQQRIGECVK